MFTSITFLKTIFTPKRLMYIALVTSIFIFGYKYGSLNKESQMNSKIEVISIDYDNKIEELKMKLQFELERMNKLKFQIEQSNAKARYDKEQLQKKYNKISIELAKQITAKQNKLKYVELMNKDLKEKLSDAENKILNTNLSNDYINWLYQ